MLTNMVVDNSGIGAGATRSSAYNKSKQPPSKHVENTFIDSNYKTSTDNIDSRVAEKASKNDGKDFNSTLEKQIQKQSSQDDTNVESPNVDEKTKSTAEQIDQGNTDNQEPVVQNPNQVVEPSKTDTETIEINAEQNISTSTHKDLSLTSVEPQDTTATNTSLIQTDTKGQESSEKAQVPIQTSNPQTIVTPTMESKTPQVDTESNNTPVEKIPEVTESNNQTQTSQENNSVPLQNSETSQILDVATTKTAIDQSTTDKFKNITQEVAENVTDQQKNGQVQVDKIKPSGEDQSDSKAQKESDLLTNNDVAEVDQPQTSNNTTVETPVAQKLAAGESQVQTQFKANTSTDTKENGKTDTDQIIPENTVQNHTGDSSNSISHLGKTTDTSQATAPNSSNIADQIQESFTTAVRQGDKQITIRLNPPELGSVKISINAHDNKITGVLEVSELQTRAEIQHTLPQIVKHLQDMGIQIKRLDVTLDSQQEDHSSMGHSLSGHDNNFTSRDGSGNSGQGKDEPDWFGSTEWLPGTNSYIDGSSPYRPFLTDSSINMLV